MIKPLLAVLRGQKCPTIPIWLMRQAGRYLPEYRELRARAGSFLDLCYSPALAAEVTLQPVRRFGFDAAILFADILLVPHALGQDVRFENGEGPVLVPVRTREAVEDLQPASALMRLAPVFETVSRVKAELAPAVALIGFAGAPWTVATYMVEGRGSAEQRAAKLWALSDSEGFGALIERLTDATIAYLIGQVRAGADAIQLFESWAGSLDEDGFRRWSIEPTRRIVSAIKAVDPSLPIIGFPRNAGAKLKEYAVETGVDAVGVDWATPLSWARQAVPGHVALQGNLDPLLLLRGGKPMTEAVDRILRAMQDTRFVFNLGHGILPETPIDHVTALLAQIRKGSA